MVKVRMLNISSEHSISKRRIIDVVPPTPPPSPTKLPKEARQLVLQVPHGLDNEKSDDDPSVRQKTTVLQVNTISYIATTAYLIGA